MAVFIQNDALKLARTDYYGNNTINGTLKNIKGATVPFSELKLFNQALNSFILSVYSDKSGKYEVHNINLKKGPFFIIAHDQNKEFNAVVADNIGGANYVVD